jgi:RNA polymerase-interacting CarD/CdnL/TRCF family regulator
VSLKNNGFQKGEWIVHSQHGVGQVLGVERRTINGMTQAYVRVDGKKYEWWISATQSDVLRRISKPGAFKRALRELSKRSEKLPSDDKTRLDMIRKARTNGSPLAICRMLRDLTSWAGNNRLSIGEKKAIVGLKESLLQEWEVVLEVSRLDAEQALKDLLAGYGIEPEEKL